MNKKYDVIVIGGGASGLMSAGVAGECGQRVLLLEKMEKLGRKIRITGKGRCNLTNNRIKDDFLNKINCGANFFERAYDSFSNFRTMEFFEKQGLPLVEERGGRVYPESGDAWDVVETLEKWCIKNKVEIRKNVLVERVEKKGNVVCGVIANGEFIESPKVIIATGGFSYPTTGSTGDGCRFAYNLGHNIVPVRPALVPFDINIFGISELKGLLLKNIALSLFVDDVLKETLQGEVEFYSFGIGGATTLRLSREAVDALDEGKKTKFVLDLKPSLSIAKLQGRIQREVGALKNIMVAELLRKLMPKQMIQIILKQSGFRARKMVSTLNDNEILKLINTIKNVELPIIDHRGFKEAIITAGGVSLKEINPNTMESKIVKGLYFAGEVMDIDADTGGFNLQVAFSTAYLAGKK